jgi:hypothetical protein
VQNPRVNTFQKKVNNVLYSSDSEGEAEIGLVEWTKKKELVSCHAPRRIPRGTGSTSTRPIRSLTCCHRRDRSNCFQII